MRWYWWLVIVLAIIATGTFQLDRAGIIDVSDIFSRLTERRLDVIPADPDRLVEVQSHLTTNGKRGVFLLPEALQAYEQMKVASRIALFDESLLTIVSGYRSPATQKRLWEDALAKYGSVAEARKWVAPPGRSTHETGKAIDLWLGISNDSRNADAQRETPQWLWLAANAERFGFYPYKREPWHWEYNPQ